MQSHWPSQQSYEYRFWYYSHFIDGESEGQRDCDFPNTGHSAIRAAGATLCKAKRNENWPSDSKSTARSQFNIEETWQLNNNKKTPKTQRVLWHQEGLFPPGISQASSGGEGGWGRRPLLTSVLWCTGSAGALQPAPRPALLVGRSASVLQQLRAECARGWPHLDSPLRPGRDGRRDGASRQKEKCGAQPGGWRPGRGVREKATQWVTVKADIMGTVGAGRTLEEVILINRMSSEGYSVDI